MKTILIDLESIDRFIENARYNLLTIENRLKSLGYNFANPFGEVQLADSSAIDSIRLFECRFGDIPILFRRWYQTFRCIDFSQAYSQLYGIQGDPIAGLVLFELSSSLSGYRIVFENV